MLAKLGPFCGKDFAALLQVVTRSPILIGQHVAVERTSALMVRLTAKVQPDKLVLLKSMTASFEMAAIGANDGH